MNVWRHLYLEGYCFFSREKAARKLKRPAWCLKKFKGRKSRVPELRCLYGPNDERCPFFGFSEACKSDIKTFEKAYYEKIELEEKE